jgi:hypothetical protein
VVQEVAATAVADACFSLEIAEASPEEARAFLGLLGCEIGNRRVYRLRGEEVRGFVAAGALSWIEDPEGSVHEPGALSRGHLPKHVDVFADEYT